MRGPRNYAQEKSKIARKARPLGQFIVDQLHAKTAGPPRVPSCPVVGPEPVQGKILCRTTHANLRKKRPAREAPVLHDCLAWLHAKGICAWRQNTGTVWLGERPISYGYPGSGDITGILPDGRRLEIECKSPTGNQSEKQKKFQQKIEANHGVYLLIRSVAELEEQWTKLSLEKSE